MNVSETLSQVGSTKLVTAENNLRPLAGDPAGTFAQTLRGAGATHSDSTLSERSQVRDAANKLVASAFVLPVLAQLRESPFAAGPFAPGTAERRFGPLLDTRIADRVVSSSNFNLVDSIIQKYAGAPADEAQPGARTYG